MSVHDKLGALAKIYALYDTFAGSDPVACRKRCVTCCTTDVTVTTLEALHLWQGMDPGERKALRQRLMGTVDLKRYRPAVTTNRLAEICAAGNDPPEEERSGSAQECPLLASELCSIYPLRPFHCRCMVSQQCCDQSGAATMPSFTMTVNSVFLQVIEHLDTPGCSGNLLDVLPLISKPEGRRDYEEGALACGPAGLMANRSLKILMVPPAHRGRIGPVLHALQSIRSV